MREFLLSLHLLAVIVWLGAGFYELWLGRLFLRSRGSSAEAVLIRAVYRSDLVVFAATLIAFGAGLAMAILLGWGFFTSFWLGTKQAFALAILAVVALILPRALRLGKRIDALPPGDGPVTEEIRRDYAALEPWYAGMRVLGVIAVLLAVWRPA